MPWLPAPPSLVDAMVYCYESIQDAPDNKP
jgi:hypothetical protein